MAGPERTRSASPVPSPQQALGAVGEASQLVEAALQARSAASQDQRFATTKTLFFALSSLNSALKLALRRKATGQGKAVAVLRPDCEACVNTLHGVLRSKKLEITAPFSRSVAECLRQAFELCDSLNAVGNALDLHKLLENRKALPESKIAVLEALGEVSKAVGLRVVSVLPESVAVVAKLLKQLEPLVRVKAACALTALIDGAGGVGSSVHGEALKAAIRATGDRCPEVRVEAYKLCLALAEAAPNLAAPASPVPLEALVALCVRGLDDESPAARLSAAAATGAALARGAEGSAAENERLGVIAARDQGHDGDDEGNAAGSGGGGGGSSASKTFAKLKEMGNDMKAGMSKLSEKKLSKTLLDRVHRQSSPHKQMPPLGDSLTPEKVVQFLSELFRRATFPSPTSREYMAGVAEAFVCLWRRPFMMERVNSSTVSKLVGAVLDLLDTDRLPQAAGETGLVRTAVEYIVREGVSAPLPELAQQLVAREMLQILGEVAGSAPPASGFPPLMNEHQIQVCLVELSHLTRALGQACAALKDTMAACLSALLTHPSYGVRFEAAVALASLGSALPWCAAGLLQQCLDEIRQQYDALMEDGMLSISPPAPAIQTVSKLPASTAGAAIEASKTTAEVLESDGGAGEPDADLELDGEVDATSRGDGALEAQVDASDGARGSSDAVGSVAGPSGVGKGRINVATKRLRLLLLHGTSAAASLLLQVARELPMGIPSKVAEDSFVAAEKLIRVQFLGIEVPAAASDKSGPSGKDGDGAPTEETSRETGATAAAAQAPARKQQQHPMGVVCSCVRTGWSLMSSLFCVGEEWAEGKADRLMNLWASCMDGVQDVSAGTRLRGLEPAHELILLDASTRALLWFLRTCPSTLCMVPERLTVAVKLIESAMEAVEGRLKSPAKKQGIICRTLLKALLMECFAWLPPDSFPSSSARLFKWSLDHMKMYTLNDVQSSLLPELLHPDDAVLSVASSAKVPSMSGVGSLVEGEDSDRVLAQVALVSGVPIGPQERDAMVCSVEVWAGRGPSPARKRRQLEHTPPTPLHAPSRPPEDSPEFSDWVRGGGGWKRPLPSSASINVRLLDAAVQVFAACFGRQSDEARLAGIKGLVQALPEQLQAAAALAGANGGRRSSANGLAAGGSGPGGLGKKDTTPFIMPGLLSEEDRRRRDKRHRLAVLNVCSALLAALKSMPPLDSAEGPNSSTEPRHNIDLPWVARASDILLELLASDETMARRAAAEGLALLGLKVGDGYAVYLIQDLLKILRSKTDKKKSSERDTMLNAYRRAGAMFALACLKRTMGTQVVLNWFWSDVQRELSVGGDVVQPARTWGLHATSLLVEGLDEDANPTMYSEVQEVVKYLSSIVELLEAHFLDSWTPSTSYGSKRSSGSASSSSSSVLGREGQSVLAHVPGLASVLARLLCTLLPVLQTLQPSSELVGRFIAIWSVLRHNEDSRVTHGCLELVELLAMFAPGAVPDALPEIMPFLQGVLRGGVGGSSPECLSRVATCVKLVAARVPEAVEGYRPELELYSCLESVLGSLTWEGAPTWRGVVVSRDVERHFGVRVEAARQLEVAIETVAGVDQAGYRPLHWLLLGKALVVGTGHVQQPFSGGAADGGEAEGYVASVGGGGPGKSTRAATVADWSELVQQARHDLARFASPLASSRWQVKRSAVRGCVMVLADLESKRRRQQGSSLKPDERVSCLDVNMARRVINRAIRTLAQDDMKANGSGTSGDTGSSETTRSTRPMWARVPTLLCLYVEDMVTLACAAATASTDDSELLDLQEAGVMMLTEVVGAFAQVPDSDADDLSVVTVGGKSVRAPTLALELSISQITGAARPALGCKVSPRLAQRGCELVVTLVREGLVKDTVVLRRLVRQVMPEEVLAVSAMRSGFERSRRRSRASRTPSPRPSRNKSPRWQRDNAPASQLPQQPVLDKDGERAPTGDKSPAKAEAFALREAVEASYRPKVSEVYGMHVPLEERAARLQCLATLSLVAGGEDEPESGGGSGSGAIIPDGLRRGLMDALREHLPVLGLHWLANVKDAVRLNQGDASGLWPSTAERKIGAGLTYPPGVKPILAKGPLRGKWPPMAAAAAAEFARSTPVDQPEAGPFLLSVCTCGLIAAKEGLGRRRESSSRRHGRAFLSSPGGDMSAVSAANLGAAVSQQGEDDEAQMAEDASLMFLTGLRCLFSRPDLLGDPAKALSPLKEAGDSSSVVEVQSVETESVPLSTVVGAVETLTSPSFLPRGGTELRSGEKGRDDCPPRLQLAAVAVLRSLVTGEGARYVIKASERQTLTGDGADGQEALGEGFGVALWEAVVGGVLGAAQTAMPAAFEELTGQAGKTQSSSFEADFSFESGGTAATGAVDGTRGTGDFAAVDAAAASALANAVDNLELSKALSPLLECLPPMCPPSERVRALPSLLLLALRVVGAVAGRMLRGEADEVPAVVAAAAVNFVRSSAKEICVHAQVQTHPPRGPGGASAARDAKERVRRDPMTVEGDPTSATAAKSGGAEAEAAVEDEDDEWGEDDFQGAGEELFEVPTPGADRPQAPAASSDDKIAQSDGGTSTAVEEPERNTANVTDGEGERVRSDVISGDMSGSDSDAGDGHAEEQPAGVADTTGEESGTDLTTDNADIFANTDGTDSGSPSATAPGIAVETIETAGKDDAGDAVVEESAGSTGAETDKAANPLRDSALALEGSSANLIQEDPLLNSSSSPDEPSARVGPTSTESSSPDSDSGTDDDNGEVFGKIKGAQGLVLGATRAINALLDDLLRRGAFNGDVTSNADGDAASARVAVAISVVAQAWGAVALVIPQEAKEFAGSLQVALSCPSERCSVAVRLALFRAVASAITAATQQGSEDPKTENGGAAPMLLRLVAPHALAGLRLEVVRAAAVAGNGSSVGAEELRQACVLEGVRVAQLAFEAAPEASHSNLLGLLLPLYASALALKITVVNAAIGQALLNAARASAAAFKGAVAFVGTDERQALEGAVRGAMTGRAVAPLGGAVSGAGGLRVSAITSTRKLDLSQYSNRA